MVLILILILFSVSFLIFIRNFKKLASDSGKIWISISIIILLITGYYIGNRVILVLKTTTTEKSYLNNCVVDSITYKLDSDNINNIIDSLIKIKIVQEPADFALRFFDGKSYEDTIERAWAMRL